MLDRDEELKLLAFLASLAGLHGIVVGAAVASQYPTDYAFAGFWLSVIFYLALQRWHKTLKWQLEPNNPA